jgi:hypothetical protein
MKKSVVILLLIFITHLFVGCNETDDGTYTDPITIYEKMGGTWRLTKLLEVDEIAVASSLKPDEITLTNQFDFKTLNNPQALRLQVMHLSFFFKMVFGP